MHNTFGLTLLLSLLPSELIFGQTVDYSWQKSSLGYGDQIVSDAKGDAISFFKIYPNQFNFIKYNKSGHNALSIVSQEGFIIGDNSFGFADKHQNIIMVVDARANKTKNGDTIVLLKFDPKGNLLIKNEFLQKDSLSQNIRPIAASVDKNDNVYVAALEEIDSAKNIFFITRILRFDSASFNVSWDMRLNQNVGEASAFEVRKQHVYLSYNLVSKIGITCYSTKDGSITYQSKSSINNPSKAVLGVDSNGNAYVVGGKEELELNSDSGMVFKFNKNGKVKWENILPPNLQFPEYRQSVLIDSSNKIHVFGLQDTTVKMLIYDSNGNLINQTSSPHGLDGIFLVDQVIDKFDNTCFLIGGASSLSQYQGYTEFLEVFDSLGNEIYFAPFPDLTNSEPDKFYNHITGDSVTGELLFNGFNQNDVLTSATNISFQNKKSLDEDLPIQLSPNPSSNILTLQTKKSLRFSLINQNGEILIPSFECDHSKSINISNLPPGEYWIISNDDKNKWKQAFIKF